MVICDPFWGTMNLGNLNSLNKLTTNDILLRSSSSGISLLMRRFLTGYATYLNLRHRRHGQWFQNRFKSIIYLENAYLQELVRYIHNINYRPME